MMPSFAKPRNGDLSSACYYDYLATRCYSRFAICTRLPNPQKPGTTSCQLRAVTRLPPTPDLLKLLPQDLHPAIYRAQVISTNDEDRFSTCLMFDKLAP